jgi:Ca2+-transporting ATPase
MNIGFHAKSAEQSLTDLRSDASTGLDASEAALRLDQNGPNRLKGAKKKPLFMRVIEQFKDFLVIILIIAAVISIVAGDGLKDAVIIFCILIVNMVIGVVQENKADNALKKLKDMSAPKAKVKRNGHIERIDSDKLVTGDVVMLDAGDYIPADLRLIESVNLRTDESALTGESAPVGKDASAVLEVETVLGDRINLASMGTVVTYGRGMGVVCATGMDTEMGKIAALLNETNEAATPLQSKLNNMAKTLGIVCVLVCAFIFFVGFLRGMEIVEMMMVSVSLAVAAVPEGIAIVATVILAIGVQKMVRSNVIVKKLRAVETLGSTTVICSDKTGTLTQNKMTVVKVYDNANVREINGTGMAGGISENMRLIAEIGILCNDAVYDKEKESIIGDPTEGAMLVLGAKWGMDKNKLNTENPRVQEIPFDSDRKLMSVLNKKENKLVMHTKGAADAIINRCAFIFENGQTVPITEAHRVKITNQNEVFASDALRVLGFAFKECDSPSDFKEEGLTFAGLMALIDPPRREVKGSVAKCHAAGITVKMITGDHKITAAAIARSLGIMDENGDALDGHDLNNLNDEDLREKVKTVNVFARVSPEHKVRIVTAVKQNNHIVAMTGDGVNDAPSLKKADIGIAMGITGTDVSKEAADMILVDDNFTSIVEAVEEGRTIYGNIQKVTGYLLSCNIGEILIIFLAIVCGLPVPLVATQLLFVNLLTDALPAFALGMEEREPGVMNRKPRDPGEALINKGMKGSVCLRSVLICVGALGSFLYGHYVAGDYKTAISMCFFTLVASELLVAYPSRANVFFGFGKKLYSNRFLNLSTLASMAILFAVMYVPFLNDLFTTVPLNVSQLLLCVLFIMIPLLGGEGSKRVFRI